MHNFFCDHSTKYAILFHNQSMKFTNFSLVIDEISDHNCLVKLTILFQNCLMENGILFWNYSMIIAILFCNCSPTCAILFCDCPAICAIVLQNLLGFLLLDDIRDHKCLWNLQFYNTIIHQNYNFISWSVIKIYDFTLRPFDEICYFKL